MKTFIAASIILYAMAAILELVTADGKPRKPVQPLAGAISFFVNLALAAWCLSLLM